MATINYKRRAPRKSTFMVRKEEKQRLEREIAMLQAQLHTLHTSSSSSTSSQRKLVRDRHLVFMGVRSLLSRYAASPGAIMYAEPIHLPRAVAARRTVLAQSSATRIHAARLLLRERCRFLDLAQPHVATEWVERDDRSMVLLQFDVTPFDHCSVRALYDAVGFYTQNVEIYVSERLGDLTIREDDEVDGTHESDGPLVSQRRLMSRTSVGLTIDANVAVFRQHFADGASRDMPQEHAVFGTQAVASDALYPYVPVDRVRHDLDGACIIQQVTTPSGARVATLVRLSVVTRHSSGGVHSVPEAIQPTLRSLAMQWIELMLLAVRERVDSRDPTVASPSASSPSTASS